MCVRRGTQTLQQRMSPVSLLLFFSALNIVQRGAARHVLVVAGTTMLAVAIWLLFAGRRRNGAAR